MITVYTHQRRNPEKPWYNKRAKKIGRIGSTAVLQNLLLDGLRRTPLPEVIFEVVGHLGSPQTGEREGAGIETKRTGATAVVKRTTVSLSAADIWRRLRSRLRKDATKRREGLSRKFMQGPRYISTALWQGL